MPTQSFIRFRQALMALLVIWVLTTTWLGSDSGISVPALLIIVGGVGLLLLVWFVLLIVAWKRKERMKAAWVEPAVVALLLAAVYSGAFFHLRFLASRQSLDRYVAQVLSRGGAQQKRMHIGLFVARETEVLPNGVVRIITASCMFDDCGVAFSRTEPPVVGEDRYEHLSGNWWRWWRRW